jgi:Tol biopolymer transport system component
VPVWSRDGKYILFARTDEHDIGTVWLMRPDGSDAREVAAPSEKDGTSDFDGPELFGWSFRL